MYSRLTESERIEIYAMLKAQKSQSEIAATLECHRSTISRELKRNTGGRGYRPKQADAFAQERVSNKASARSRMKPGLR